MSARTVYLIPGPLPTRIAWPAMQPLDVLPSVVDMSGALKDLGLTIVGPATFVQPDGTLTVSLLSQTGYTLTFQVGPGPVGMTPLLTVVVPLSGNNTLELTIQQPIVTPNGGPPSPAVNYLTTSAAAMIYQTAEQVETAIAEAGQASFYTPLTAGGAINGHRVLMPDGLGKVVHADPSNPSYVFAGISSQAAANNATVLVAEDGLSVTEPSWAWTPGSVLYVGPDGTLTQTPPDTGILQQVAIAITSTIIVVQTGPAINRQ